MVKKEKIIFRIISLFLFIIGMLFIGLKLNITGAIIGIEKSDNLSFLLGLMFIFGGLVMVFMEGKLERIIIRKGTAVGRRNITSEVFDRIIMSRPDVNKVETSEEAKKRKEKYIEKGITPELLKYFSRDEAGQLVRYFEQVPHQRTQEEKQVYDLYELKGEDLDFIEEEIKGKRVIEFGDAGRKINKDFFLELGAKSFDSFNPGMGDGNDALSYFSKQSKNSVIVASFGVLDDGVLYNNVDNLRRYVSELTNQIYRVTPPGGLTIHGLEYKKDLIKAGFKPEKVFKERNGKYLIAFRKPKKEKINSFDKFSYQKP